MTTEEYQTHLLKEVAAKVNAHKEGNFEQMENDKLSDQEYLKNLSPEEINNNWEKVQEVFKSSK